MLEGRFLLLMLETGVLAGEAKVLWDAASLAGTGFPVTLCSKDDRPIETKIKGVKRGTPFLEKNKPKPDRLIEFSHSFQWEPDDILSKDKGNSGQTNSG